MRLTRQNVHAFAEKGYGGIAEEGIIGRRLSATGARERDALNVQRNAGYLSGKAILYYLRLHIENVQANYRDESIAPYELDIYLPEYRLAIEYDGTYGHSKGNGIARDLRKTGNVRKIILHWSGYGRRTVRN